MVSNYDITHDGVFSMFDIRHNFIHYVMHGTITAIVSKMIEVGAVVRTMRRDNSGKTTCCDNSHKTMCVPSHNKKC